jgi:hypothetical protein
MGWDGFEKSMSEEIWMVLNIGRVPEEAVGASSFLFFELLEIQSISFNAQLKYGSMLKSDHVPRLSSLSISFHNPGIYTRGYSCA